jgi:hypothetical protein
MELDSFQFLLFIGQITHLTDFAQRLLSASFDLSDYPAKHYENNTELENLSFYLQQSCFGLRWPPTARTMTNETHRMLELGEECKELMFEFLDCIDELKRKRPFLQPGCFRYAIQDIRTKQQVQALKLRLQSLCHSSTWLLSDLLRFADDSGTRYGLQLLTTFLPDRVLLIAMT